MPRGDAGVPAAHGDAALGVWAALDVAPDALAAAIGWTERALALLPSPPARAAARRLVAVTPDREALEAALDEWRDALHAFLPELDRDSLTDDLEGDFDDAAALIDRLTRTRGDIETWIAHAAAVDRLHDLEAAVGFCIERRVPAQQLVDVLERSALEHTADRLLQRHADDLGPLRATERDRLVKEYAKLDERIVRDAAHRVMDAANERRPNAILGVAAHHRPGGAEEAPPHAGPPPAGRGPRRSPRRSSRAS